MAKLPDGVDEQHVVTAAGERSMKLYPMSAYRDIGATEPAQIVLGFGNLSHREIERGIEAIVSASTRTFRRSPYLEPAPSPTVQRARLVYTHAPDEFATDYAKEGEVCGTARSVGQVSR